MSYNDCVRVVDTAVRVVTDYLETDPDLAQKLRPNTRVCGFLPLLGQYLHLSQNPANPVILPQFRPLAEEFGPEFVRRLNFGLLYAPRILGPYAPTSLFGGGPIERIEVNCHTYNVNGPQKIIGYIDLYFLTFGAQLKNAITPIFAEDDRPYFPQVFFNAVAQHVVNPEKIQIPHHLRFTGNSAEWAECLKLSSSIAA